jgi:predicted DNA-binding protein
MPRAPNDLKDVTFGIRLGPEDAATLASLAQMLDRPKGEVVRALIREAAARTSRPLPLRPRQARR